MPENSPSSHTFVQKSLAWATHAFTASGMFTGFMAVVAISQHQFSVAFYWLAAALVIDGVDGTFARLFKVKEVLPHVDGKMMDYVVDFANYALIPAYFIYECGWMVEGSYQYLLPEEVRLLAVAIILIVSVIYYGLSGMVTTDFYFVGFPVMWNAVAFYLFFVLKSSEWVNFGLILFFAAAHFMPIKVVYPSRTKRFMVLNILSTVLLMIANIWLMILAEKGEDLLWLRIVSGACLLYLVFVSLLATFESDPSDSTK